MHAVDPQDYLAVRLRQGERDLDLQRADLRGADLSDLDLSGLDLSGADLSGARLLRTDLSDTLLYGADLTDTVLASANLRRADLTEAQAERAAFSGADLTDANLFSVDLTDGSLAKADLSGAELRCAKLVGCNLSGATLHHAHLDGADLEDAKLCEASLGGSSWRGCSIRGADFRGVTGAHTAQWIGVQHISRADFEGAMLVRRHILDELFLDEFKDRFPAVYWLWWVSSDCGRSLARWGAWTMVITIAYAMAYTFVGLGWGENVTWFSPLYFSIVTLTTLGYGDVLPINAAGQALAVSQAIVGYVMLGGLISILSNKLARRAD